MNNASDRQGRLVGEVTRKGAEGRGNITSSLTTFYFNGSFLREGLSWEDLRKGDMVEFTPGEGIPFKKACDVSLYVKPPRPFRMVETKAAIFYPELNQRVPLILGEINESLRWKIDYDEELGLFVLSSRSIVLPAIEVPFDGNWIDPWPLYQVSFEDSGEKRLFFVPKSVFREVQSSFAPFLVFGRRYTKAYFEVFVRPQSLPQQIPLWPPTNM